MKEGDSMESYHMLLKPFKGARKEPVAWKNLQLKKGESKKS
jgi:hypothetical protein